jgi:hypothetical protein
MENLFELLFCSISVLLVFVGEIAGLHVADIAANSIGND